MITHSFTPNPRSIGGMMCLVCGKTRTHVMHEGQGVAEPEYQDDPTIEQEAAQQAAEAEIRYAYPQDTGVVQSLPMPDNYFRVESMGDGLNIEIAVHDCPREVALAALLEFMEAVKAKPEDPVVPQTKKKR